MPMWTCNFADCNGPAVRNSGDCILCNRHLCSEHLLPTVHKCPKWEDADNYDPAARAAEADELSQLIKKINTTALEARASQLRQGTPCSIPALYYDREKRSSVMGGMNYHVEICFEDGVKWIARVRRFNATSPPPMLQDHIARSEVATLKFLAHTAVPAPKVFDFATEGPENLVGVGYILMEKLPGKSLRWDIATQEQKERILRQLADIFIELSNHPFDLIGSLDSPGNSHVGAFARESLTNFAESEMRTMGPFSYWEEYHRSLLQFVLDLILGEELYSQQSVDAYLIHRFLIDLIPSVLPHTIQDDQKYYLKHADDKGDHILVDEDFNITGIIDWEWAHTAPPIHAFNSPIGILPVGEFYEGMNNLGDHEIIFAHMLEEKGRLDIAQCVRDGRLQHRFAFCCGYDLADWDGFLGLFKGLRDAVGVDDGLDWDKWKTVALHRYSEDAGLQLLLTKHANVAPEKKI
ncbi:kinase-like domain-containing protein [Xylaria cf. heliscus]|nr:kinase-like domain-containing protein [Xylaria cf. heliscus]